MIALLARWAVGFGIGKLALAVTAIITVGGFGLYVWSLKSDAATARAAAESAKAKLELALASSDANFAAYKIAKSDAERAAVAMLEEQRLSEKRAQRVAQLLKDIHLAEHQETGCRPGNDDPVADVLDLAIDGGLRDGPTGRTGDNPGGNRARDSPPAAD